MSSKYERLFEAYAARTRRHVALMEEVARMSRSGARNRTEVVGVRLTKLEKAFVEAEARRRGISPPDLFRLSLWTFTAGEDGRREGAEGQVLQAVPEEAVLDAGAGREDR